MTPGLFAFVMAIVLLPFQASSASDRFITMASTTSTANSGLLDHLLPVFSEMTGIEVRVVAVGTGQAIRLAQNGDADVLFVHDKASELAFVEEGFGVERFDVMYNDFVLVGPEADPAEIQGQTDITIALSALASGEHPFASRGDDSGTHKRELALWADAGLEDRKGTWYRETGSGMGATLNVATGMGAYTLTDRATWLAFENKDGMAIMSEGDPRLFNQYGVIAVNQEAFPHIKAQEAQTFVEWLISPVGQQAIADFTRDGTQLFFPNFEQTSGS